MRLFLVLAFVLSCVGSSAVEIPAEAKASTAPPCPWVGGAADGTNSAAISGMDVAPAVVTPFTVPLVAEQQQVEDLSQAVTDIRWALIEDRTAKLQAQAEAEGWGRGNPPENPHTRVVYAEWLYLTEQAELLQMGESPALEVPVAVTPFTNLLLKKASPKRPKIGGKFSGEKKAEREDKPLGEKKPDSPAPMMDYQPSWVEQKGD